MPADSLAKLNRSLDEIARKSVRGEKSVASRRIIFRAMAAASKEQFHRIISELPVTVTVRFGEKGGVPGTYRQYSIRGQENRKGTELFFPTRFAHETPAESRGDQWLEGEGESIFVPGSSDRSRLPVTPDTLCSWTGPDGYEEGPCVTQEEIDDIMAAVEAMDAELEGWQSEAAAEDECQVQRDQTKEYEPGPCVYYHHEEPAGAALSIDALSMSPTDSGLEFDTDYAAASSLFSVQSPPCTDRSASVDGVSPPDCTWAFIGMGTGLFAYAGAKYAMVGAILGTSGTITAVGAFFLFGGVMVAGTLAAVAIISYVNCRRGYP